MIQLQSTDERLIAAAKAGDIDILYTLIRKSPYLLELIDHIPFADTPLHVAASTGQHNLAMEIMRLKPSFARKLNQDGFSPMHLAFQNEQTLMVLRLIDIDSDLVRVKGRDGVTPLHYVADKGILHLLAEFLSRCPESIEDETIRKETAMHIALKSGMVEAFQVLIGWLRSFCHEKAETFQCTLQHPEFNPRQAHIYSSFLLVKQVSCLLARGKVVRLLLNCGVDVNMKNLAGLTALDILYQSHQLDNREIKNMLQCAGALSGSPLPSDNIPVKHLRSKISFTTRITVLFLRGRREITNDLRSLLLVIAVLVATATYQAILNPTGGGGVFQASHNPGNNYANIPTNTTSNITTTIPMLNDGSPPQPPVRTIVTASGFYNSFTHLNTLTFLTTIIVISYLIPLSRHGLSKYITFFCLVPLYWVFGRYMMSLTFLTPSSYFGVLDFCILMLLLVPFVLWVKSWRCRRVKAIITQLLRRNDLLTIVTMT